MPNGGTAHCAFCKHNRALKEVPRPHTAPEQQKRFKQVSYCTLRNQKTANPYWTNCANFNSGTRPEEESRSEVIDGWICATGLYEGYVKIPWDDDSEPRVQVPATCSICGLATDTGIEIDHDGQVFGFCTNRHYVEWWKTLHKDDKLKPECFEAPEERYRKK